MKTWRGWEMEPYSNYFKECPSFKLRMVPLDPEYVAPVGQVHWRDLLPEMEIRTPNSRFGEVAAILHELAHVVRETQDHDYGYVRILMDLVDLWRVEYPWEMEWEVVQAERKHILQQRAERASILLHRAEGAR